ncbi:S8 family peptidase [Micromonospora cathayae]|uniref:S8 family peptidase n=1 Tax=Micromonospora cathayae TaxID=3028804 RepID=A0ABY7ZJE1_9ACTN|nr:S8 family peptidase [Micromonospora sp. HUAS 3]WDZ82623.1 S8 family peptidase [Micromonospora sp. HUAS 3]
MRKARPRPGRWLAAVAAVATATLAVTATVVTPAYAEGEIRNAHHPDAIPGSYLVVYADTEVTADDAQTRTRNLAARYRAKVEHTYRHALRGFAARLSEQAARRLAAEPGVAYVAQNATVRATGTQPSPPSWGLNRIDQRNLPLDSSYTYPSTAPSVTAYIIDTGIRTTHSDFGGRAVWGTNTVDGNNTDCNGHGTHVAGTVGGASYGVAKGVRLVAVKVLDCAGSGSFAAVAAGVDWVTGHHVSGPAVANMSLGGSGSDATVENAVRRSIADGVVYAIASGNSSSDACNFTPARVAEAITVNASDSADNRASFSNYGTCTDIFAPGVGITSAWSSGDTAANTISGTSMAAPHVAGAAALILNDNPGLTPAQVASTMYTNATPNKITNPGSGSPNRLLFVNGGTPDTVQVNNPGNQTSRRNVATSLQMSASGGTAPYTWSAAGLPAGLSINSSTGLISGTPTTASTYTVTVTARDAASRTGSTSFSWAVTENLDNTWACSVPAGYTYDRVTNDLNRCNPGGWAYTYRLRAPADSITVCSVPAGFTYDRVTNDLNVCNPSSFAYSYRIRVPVVGLWACSVPAGFSYSQSSNNLNVCHPSGFAYSYLLSR